LELQFQPHPKPFGVLFLSFGKAKSPPKGFMHQNGVTPAARIKESQNSSLCYLSQFWTRCGPSLSTFCRWLLWSR